MRKRIQSTAFAIITLALLVTSSAALARQEPPATQPATGEKPGEKPIVVDVSDKAAVDAAMNKEVFLEGVVESAAWSSSGKVMRIQFKGAGESKVQAVIFEKKRVDFDQAFGGDVGKALTGARVRVRGKLKDYKGTPEVTLDQISQLTILDEAPATKPS
jgi:DNA/RNA endonuclease YhcR with UshA esterase domain